MEDKDIQSSSSVSKSDSDVSDEEMADSSEDTPQNIKIKSEPSDSDSDSTEHVSEFQPKPKVFFGVAASNYQDIIKAVSVFNTEDDGDDPLFRKKKQLTADEIRTRWNVHKIFKRLGTQEQCLQFALDRALLPASRLCRRHKTPMKLQTIGDSIGRFQCTKDICRNRAFSRSDHTFFEGCQMQLRLIFEMMYFYSNGYDYEQTQRECYIPDRDAALHLDTIALWFGYCREAVVIYQIKHQKEKPKIGGPGRLVILDESKMGYTKHEGGKTRRGHWMRTVKRHVIEGSTIRASDWAAYRCLCDHGYAVEVTDDASERPWQVLKCSYKGFNERYHYQEDMGFAEWLVELSWRKRMKMRSLDPFEKLIECIQYVYPRRKLK